jgi:hypothetical protein
MHLNKHQFWRFIIFLYLAKTYIFYIVLATYILSISRQNLNPLEDFTAEQKHF